MLESSRDSPAILALPPGDAFGFNTLPGSRFTLASGFAVGRGFAVSRGLLAAGIRLRISARVGRGADPFETGRLPNSLAGGVDRLTFLLKTFAGDVDRPTFLLKTFAGGLDRLTFLLMMFAGGLDRLTFLVRMFAGGCDRFTFLLKVLAGGLIGFGLSGSAGRTAGP